MVLPIGGNQDSSYQISNSLMFAEPDHAHLEKTYSGSSTSDRICTMSFWYKPGKNPISEASTIFSAIKSSSNEDTIEFTSNTNYNRVLSVALNNTSDAALMSGTSSYLVHFRDNAAWYHFVLAFDTTQSTNTNRLKAYVNGRQIDITGNISGGSPASPTYISQNYDLGFLAETKHQIGMNAESSNSKALDGYLSEFHFIDGQQLDSSYFGETNDDGVWVPKQYTGTYGNYGFFMEFKQTGTSQNSSGMGADTSGNDNHFSTSGLVALDVVTDTPTNNFCVMNPNDNYYASGIFNEGNRNLTTNASAYSFNTSTFGVSAGKWYWEAKVGNVGTGSDNWMMGVSAYQSESASSMPGATNYEVAYRNNGNYKTADSNNTHGASFSNDAIVMFALDMDNKNIYFGHNGQWADGSGNTDEANPTSAVSLSTMLGSDRYGDTAFVIFGDGNGNGSSTPGEVKFNFGQPAYSNSSDVADANGHGKFEYQPPTGYLALCTKNLAETG